jgi:hypothetical protein
VQPLELTVARVRRIGFDLQHVSAGQWQDRPVWIVGAMSQGDTLSSQFWVDPERQVVVRMLVRGAPRQLEEYSDWRAGIDR